MSKLFKFFFFILLLTLPITGFSKESPRAFVKGSFSEITNAKLGKPFILSLWSLDCSACIRELKLWSELRAQYPELNIVLVSIDGIDARQAINALLKKTLHTKSNHQWESWVFADEFVERLRYEIDPQWYGELPRTIFFSADHSRQSLSGLLERETVEQWVLNQIR